MKIIPTFFRKFVASLPFTKTRSLVKAGATYEHIKVFNEIYNQFYKNNWNAKKLVEDEKSFIALNVSPEQLKACNEVLIHFHKEKILTTHLVDILTEMLSLKATPEQISLAKKYLTIGSKKSLYISPGIIPKEQKSFFNLIKEGPSKEYCALFESIPLNNRRTVASNFSRVSTELLKENLSTDQLKLYKDTVDYHFENKFSVYELMCLLNKLIKENKPPEQWNACAKALNIYKENKWEIDESTFMLVDILKNHNVNNKANLYILGISRCKEQKLDHDQAAFTNSFKELLKIYPSKDDLDLFEQGLQNCSNPIEWTNYFTYLLKLSPKENKYNVYKKYCSLLLKDGEDIQDVTRVFTKLIMKGQPSKEIESCFQIYFNLTSHIKTNYNNTFNVNSVIDIVLANPDKELIELYKETLSVYSKAKTKTPLNPLAKEFLEYIKSDPEPIQQELYKQGLEAHKDNYVLMEKFISMSIALTKAHKDYELYKDKLKYLAPEIKKDLEDEWIYAFTDTHMLAKYKDISISYYPPLNNQIVRLSYKDFRENKDIWDIYNELALSQRKKNLSLVDFTRDFAALTLLEPSKEYWDLYKKAISYHIEHDFPLTDLTGHLASLAYAKSYSKNLKIYDEAINYFKDRKLPLDKLISSFVTLAKYNVQYDFLKEFYKIQAYFQENNIDANDFNKQAALWAKDNISGEHLKIFKELYVGYLNKKWDLNELKTDLILSIEEEYPIQLLRNIRNEIQNGSIKSAEEAEHLFQDIRFHTAIYKILRQEISKDEAKKILSIFGGAQADSLPVHIYSNSTRHEFNPEAIKIQNETERVFTRLFDLNYGFSSLTVDCKRTPTKESALLANFGNDVANVNYINAKDISLFPGRGFEISSFDLNKILIPDKTNPTDLYHLYKESWPWAKETLDNFSKTKFIFTRGFVVITNPDKKYILNGTHYSYFVVNNHHHNKGCDTAYLVPTEILEKKLKGTTIPFMDYVGVSKNHKDINEAGLQLDDLVKDANEKGLQVLNLGWGSNFSGGLCNAYPLDSKPYFKWEKKLRGKHTKDFWGRVHKSHITGSWQSRMFDDPKLKKLLAPLRKAHDEIYTLTNDYQNHFDLFRLFFSMWKKGLTVGERVLEPTSDDLFQELEPQNLEPGQFDKSAFDNEITNREAILEYSENPNSLRMLVEAYKWHEAKKQGISGPNFFPILVVTNTLDYWSQPESKIMLDTYDMTIHADGKTIPLNEEELTFIEKGLWNKSFLPYMLDSTKDLRFYDRRDLNM